MDLWILVHPVSWKPIVRYSKKDATQTALRMNAADVDHPAFVLWHVTAKRTTYIGRLWREFGHGFDSNNCWAK